MAALILLLFGAPFLLAAQEDFLRTQALAGEYGGNVVISQRGEPQTLNPLTATDSNSREILSLTMADLIHINRHSMKTEPALATSWDVSSNGREYTLRLRRGIRFSDGQAFDAADVVFTFQLYLDERLHSTQRDLLMISGKPIQVEELDSYTVRFKLPEAYAPGERLFDGIAMLPRHLLQAAYRNGAIGGSWGLSASAAQIAGLGPFRFKDYTPGQQLRLERNPYYWKKNRSGNRLPYFQGITVLFAGDAEAEAMRFQAGEVDIVNRLTAANFAALDKHKDAGNFQLYDGGPSLEYNFLFFNLNDLRSTGLSSAAGKQAWFQQLAFRKAISQAIDRAAIVRLAYGGRARPLWGPVTAGNPLWINRSIPQPARNTAAARDLLRHAGFNWNKDAALVDLRGRPVVFSILANAGNVQHVQTATLIQEDLRELGMDVRIVPLEFRALVDKVFHSRDYEAAIMSLASGDADPNSDMNVWTSSGGTHLWNFEPKSPLEPWQAEIDDLMKRQMTTRRYADRKAQYDRVQELLWENLPVICLANPDVLVGASKRLKNFQPGLLISQTLWNVEELSFGR